MPENRQNVKVVGTKKVRKQLGCAEKKNKVRTSRIKFIFQKRSLKNNRSCKDFFYNSLRFNQNNLFLIRVFTSSSLKSSAKKSFGINYFNLHTKKRSPRILLMSAVLSLVLRRTLISIWICVTPIHLGLKL